MTGLVEGKSIIVTGGGRGIGEGIARDLAAEGGRIVVADIDLAAAERVAAAIRQDKGEAIAAQVDVAERKSVQAMIKEAVRAFGRLDVMFNNAGISKAGQFLEATEADWARIMGINGLGVLIGMQEAAKQMIAQGGGGKIVNIASGSWKTARVGAAAYCASKAGVVMLTAVLAMELGPHRINVNAVAPGLINVPREQSTQRGRAYRDATVKLTPWGRMGTPEEVANVVLMLCTLQAEYVTGAVVGVDGGLSLGRYGIPVGEWPGQPAAGTS